MGLKIVYYSFAALLAVFLLYAYYMLFNAFLTGAV
jgi:hypothetical protein